jgi:hypothetical protein
MISRNKQIDLITREQAAHCYCEIIKSIKEDTGIHFFEIIRAGMLKLIDRYEAKCPRSRRVRIQRPRKA